LEYTSLSITIEPLPIEIMQKMILWGKLEQDYRDWVAEYNKTKETYFEKEVERTQKIKAMEAAEADMVASLRSYFRNEVPNESI